LKGGGVLGVAPEGTRSKTGQLIQGRSGVAFIATRADVPIVPAALWGTEKIMKRPRPHVYARFGKPFRLPEGRAKGDQLDAYTERIMCAIAALLPESYHGVYAGNPLIEEMRQLVC
jgi:1-acyl-sn-glycerol-3-phosphate acyltransferase